MKKTSKIISIFLVLILLFSFSACGSGTTLDAKFILSGVAEGDQEFDPAMLEIAMGENYREENFVQFREDETFTITFMKSTVEGTYTKKDNEITMTSEEDASFGEVEGRIDGDNFILEDEGMVITFVNVNAK